MTIIADTKSPRAYRGQAPEQRAAERRQRLLDSALDLFASQGYAKTPIEQLCTHARVTARHFYALFTSREALLAALYDDIMTDLLDATLSAISAPEHTLSDKISNTVKAVLSHYLTDARRAQVGVLEVVGVSATMERRRRLAIHQMATIIEHYLNALISEGRLPARNYHYICIALVGGINELLAESLTAISGRDLAAITVDVEFIIHALFRPLEQSPNVNIDPIHTGAHSL